MVMDNLKEKRPKNLENNSSFPTLLTNQNQILQIKINHHEKLSDYINQYNAVFMYQRTGHSFSINVPKYVIDRISE